MTLEMLVGASVFAATLRLAAPIALAALGGVTTERSGVTNIALEGSMLVGCFFGVVAADRTHNVWIGLAIAIVAGVLLAGLHAYAAIALRADQIVSGMALNILALGLTTYLDYQMYGTTGTPADLPVLPDVQLGFLTGVPYVGDAIGSQNVMVWTMGVLVILLQLFLFRTVGGLRLRAVGEHPRAAETVGIEVRRIRYAAVLASGALAALGGAYLSIAFLGSFNQNMTAGRGYIALAVVICGRWRPFGALAFACLFGFSSALAQRLPTFSESGATLFQALPYVLTIIVVAGVIGRSRPPAAVGQPYTRE